jgi:RNA polymerase sigma-70 factor (ECF subfamily)
MDQYGDYLKRTAYIVLKDHQLAEDMTQETFISYYEQGRFKGRSSLKTYLYSILMNHIKMYLRKHKSSHLCTREALEAVGSITIFEDQVVSAIDLENALLTLKDTYRLVIILYYYNDFSVGEIGQILNCSNSTVKMRLKRGRDLLKKHFEKEGHLYERDAKAL